MNIEKYKEMLSCVGIYSGFKTTLRYVAARLISLPPDSHKSRGLV
jgi:hypothetical protein